MAPSAATGSGEHRTITSLGSLAGVEVVSIATGLLAAYLSLAFASMVGFKLSPEDTRDIYIGVGLAAAMVGLLYWRTLTSREHALTFGRGILLGVGCSLLAHPLTWCLALLISKVAADPNGFLGTSWQTQVPAPVIELVGSVYFSIFSLIYVGWITSTAGGIVGGALAWLMAWLGARWRRAACPSA